jgi:hypothetical protein
MHQRIYRGQGNTSAEVFGSGLSATEADHHLPPRQPASGHRAEQESAAVSATESHQHLPPRWTSVGHPGAPASAPEVDQCPPPRRTSVCRRGGPSVLSSAYAQRRWRRAW